ncbi:alpha/beta fold hydrolase [Kibdelosporangium persicum]|uniref:Dihydrolipoyllysine-residue acetyltransferase component of acetoin cleaving system n=1 Tax=Kibdelosporangium persicum TaxID=2698649 RepID=A0ABX2F3Y8_9PSEU|nr:alpha/beta hydrolase [Kibdelosporangium persicum]NRN65627.1 Dihydrolipoyllysine-residue acetyltransferase component of acetoin cleaving system [Kibdelosporangium persicum]
MSDYVTVNGVRSWYDVRGDGEPLVLLHGGFSDSRDFDGNLLNLAGGFRIHLLDRRGHGRTPDVEGPVSIDMLVDDVAAFLEEVVGGPAHVAGYSTGGYVALALALRRPELVRKLVLVSTAYDKDGWMFLPQPDAQLPPELVDRYAEVSPDGRDHMPVVVRKFAEMEAGETLDPAGVASPTLILLADDDMIHLRHIVDMYEAIPQAQLGIVPATSHLLFWEKPELVTRLVEDFLTTEPAPIMPVRRPGGFLAQPQR